MKLLKILVVVFIIYFIRRLFQLYKVMKQSQEAQMAIREALLRQQQRDQGSNKTKERDDNVVEVDFKKID
jgi:ABC-type transporter lipoprotein component MlaA